ncbi:MAG: cation:dicarboxylase symporter family transporter, partial [Firmicutes bacterium]|nr:cation:dicarboxylase symporter family transporter [Bacillota bacterium]
MKNLVAKWNDIPLIARIAIGLLIGAILGMTCPSLGLIPIFGNIFVGALKGIAPILVFVLIVSALANAKNVPGKQFRTVIGLYMLTTLLASLISVIASFAFPVTLILA